MADCLDVLRSEILAGADLSARASETLGKARATFRLDRDFDDTAKIITYRFVAEIHGIFGNDLKLVQLKDGCISVELAFPSTLDEFGREFGPMMYGSPRYHDVFRRFGVERIYLHGFPNTGNVGTRFSVDSSGQPRPY